MQLTLTFDIRVDIIMTYGTVRVFVMGDVVDLPLRDKVRIDNPRGIRNNFVYPAAMSGCFTSGTSQESIVEHREICSPFRMVHDAVGFVRFDELVGTHAYEEIYIGK
jgi:hypothetical protein